MSWWMLVVGTILILVAMGDAITTTISASTRSGPLTTATNWIVSGTARRLLARRRRLLLAAGPASVVLGIGAWILTLWAGWALVFSSHPQAVVTSTTSTPVDGVGRWLFAAYTTYTLGYGNYLPTGGWEIVAAVALIVGFAVFTLSVTYAIPIVSAVTERRQQAAVITTTGTTPAEIVDTFHHEGFGSLDELLSSLVPDLLATAERHLAYPVLHNFFEDERRSALGPSLAALDEAVTLLDAGMLGPGRPSRANVIRWHRTVDSFMHYVAQVGQSPDGPVPHPPSLNILERLGIPHVNEATYLDAVRAHDDRRRTLLAYVRSMSWDWPGA